MGSIQNKYHCPFRSLIIILSILSLIFVACVGDEVVLSNSKAIGKIEHTSTINFIGHWLGEGKRETLVRNFAREYEFLHQNIKVNLKFPEDIYYDKLDRACNQKYNAKVIMDGVLDWDILRINGEYSEVTDICKDPDWAKKHLVDFSQIQEFKDGTIQELQTNEAKAEWNGIIPGPWLEGQYWALWCNNNVARKVGIEIKQFGMTFDDFVNYLQAVYNYNKAHPSEYIAPVYESFVWKTTMAIAVNLYGSLLDNRTEFLSKQINEKRLQAWEKTLEAMELIAKFKPLKRDWGNTEWSNTTGSLINEECLFYVNGSWMYNIWMGIDEKKTLNCMPTEFPSFKPLTFYPGAYQITWGVLKNSPNRDEAIKFLLAMNQPSMSEVWGRTTKCPTGIRGNLSNATFGADQFEGFSSHIQSTYGTNTYRYYESSAWFLDDKNSSTPNYYNEVIEGEITAKEAMHRIRKSIGQ